MIASHLQLTCETASGRACRSAHLSLQIRIKPADGMPHASRETIQIWIVCHGPASVAGCA
jgi:hypothetical protein